MMTYRTVRMNHRKCQKGNIWGNLIIARCLITLSNPCFKLFLKEFYAVCYHKRIRNWRCKKQRWRNTPSSWPCRIKQLQDFQRCENSAGWNQETKGLKCIYSKEYFWWTVRIREFWNGIKLIKTFYYMICTDYSLDSWCYYSLYLTCSISYDIKSFWFCFKKLISLYFISPSLNERSI